MKIIREETKDKINIGGPREWKRSLLSLSYTNNKAIIHSLLP